MYDVRKVVVSLSLSDPKMSGVPVSCIHPPVPSSFSFSPESTVEIR